MSALSVPTTSALPSSELIPSSHPAVVKTLSRLSRPSLLSLALDWLDERNQDNTAPYLAEEGNQDEDEQDLYPPASSLAELREIYTDLQAQKGSKRDVLDRIIEGDWRDGITLYQLAMADMQYLYDHPSSQKWTALKVVRLASGGEQATTSKSIPRFHPATFLRNLQKEILPDVKAHYNLDRHPTLPLLLLRIFIVESPYNTSLALSSKQATTFDASKTFYVAFPDDSPYVYVSLNTAAGQPVSRSDNKSLRRLTLEGIPKAFSRPRERYKFESTSLSTRNLDALVALRGGGRTNAAGGGWSVYAEEKKNGGDNPLEIQPRSRTPDSDIDELQEDMPKPKGLKRRRKDDARVVKRRKMLARGRFGNTALPDDGKGIERLDIRIDDLFPANAELVEDDELLADELDPGVTKKKHSGRRSTITFELDKNDDEDGGEEWRPDIRLTFTGQHVFAGIRELVEAGVVDGEKMPGWMTGEEGVSVGVVRDGRVKGSKGSGM
ncbi:Inner kinetochore subunit [Lachnellula occidentalis]|uniref:Inner kinetochore subunit n=1 Tax=Lachnellula occidentalis TaxID=215460 RepID=A0A8H8UHE1_9HELO|nr:Inner kinetochore subunit [Lachnellula occidentalis]